MSSRKNRRMRPDIPALVARFPKQCNVLYQGHWYKYMVCCYAPCKRKYWRRYSASGRALGQLTSSNPKKTYCCDACAAANQVLLNRARQSRYKARWLARDPEGYRATYRRYRAAYERHAAGKRKVSRKPQ